MIRVRPPWVSSPGRGGWRTCWRRVSARGWPAARLQGLTLLETGLMGAAASLFSLPTGLLLAVLLIYVINLRSFGWTIQLQLLPGPFLQAILAGIASAAAAGVC